MKIEMDVDSDQFDEIFRQNLIDHYFMLSGDLKKDWSDDDLNWMRPVKDALYTLITMYYSSPSQRAEFLKQAGEE